MIHYVAFALAQRSKVGKASLKVTPAGILHKGAVHQKLKFLPFTTIFFHKHSLVFMEVEKSIHVVWQVSVAM